MTAFSELHKQTLLSRFSDLHRRMEEMEARIAQSQIASPFNELVNDLSPTESKVVQDYFARVRSTLLAYLRELGIPLETRRTSLRWVLQTGVTFLHVCVSELSP